MTQEIKIPRYEYQICNDEYNHPWVEFERTEDGDHCRWDDVELLVAELRNEISQLKQRQETASANATYYAGRLMQLLEIMDKGQPK